MAKFKKFFAENGGPIIFCIVVLAVFVLLVLSALSSWGVLGCSSFAHFCMGGYFCELCGEQLRDLPVYCPDCGIRIVHDFCPDCGWAVTGG